MSNFITHVELGFKHVLDFNGYDHILFLIVLAVIFSFSQWKKVLLMITFFTVGHTFTLGLATYQIVTIKETVMNILKFSINSSKRKKTNLFFALFFGLIHGLGFSNFLRVTLGRSEDKLIPMLEFALGIELAQIVIVLSVLILGTVLIHFFRVSKRDWVVITSAIVIGITIPIIRDSYVAWSS